jgi:hypothetical protein
MMIESENTHAQGIQPHGIGTYRGSGPLWMVLLFGALLFVSSLTGAAADMRGDQFITLTDGNALSGTDSAGSAFSLYFLPGGEVTYVGPAGGEVYGTWDLDKDGDVCLRLPHRVDAMNGCFAITVNGAKVTWRAKHLPGSAQRRGSVVETFIRPASNRG